MPVLIGLGGAFDQALAMSRLAAGPHTLTLTAMDAAGHSATATLDLTLGEVIPLTVIGHTPASGAADVGSTYRPQVFFSRPVDPATSTARARRSCAAR